MSAKEKPTLDEIIGKFNTEDFMFYPDILLSVLYDMLEEHYKQTEEWQST
jgi:hypothetical protein